MHFTTILSTSIVLAGSAYAQMSSSSESSMMSASESSMMSSSMSSMPSMASGSPSASGAASGTASGASATSSAMMTVHVIAVSDSSGQLMFAPNSVQAKVGDMIQWQFYKGNHSIVESNFAQPCVPIKESDSANAANAFFSGFMPVENSADDGRLTFTIPVKDTNPMWYYCAQANHCQSGMVGVVNPPSDQSMNIQTYANNAKKATKNSSPGSGATGGTTSSSSGPSATASNGAAKSGAAAPANMVGSSFMGMALAGVFAFLML